MARLMLLYLVSVCFTATCSEVVQVDASGAQSQAARISSASGSNCVDRRADCEALAGDRLERCGDDPVVMLVDCAHTCGACPYRSLVQEAMSCEDTHDQCANWARSGECQANVRRAASRKSLESPAAAAH